MDATVQRLYLGDHHILNVRSRFFTEDYRRYALKDIQAIRVVGTNRWLVGTLILGGIIAAVGAILTSVATVSEDEENVLVAVTFLAPVLLLASIALLVHGLRGSTCRTWLHTAVQAEDLTSLRRTRAARRFIEIVQPLIEQEQSAITPEVLQVQAATLQKIVPSEHADLLPLGQRPQRVRHVRGALHATLFGILAITGLIWLFTVNFDHPVKRMFDGIIALVYLSLLLWALAIQHGSDLPGAVKMCTWLVLALYAGAFMAGSVIGMVMVMNNPSTETDYYAEALRSPGVRMFTYGVALIQIVIALIGLYALQRRQSSDRSQPYPDDSEGRSFNEEASG